VSEQAGSQGAQRLEELLARLDGALADLERSTGSEDAVERLTTMAELAREVQAEIERLRREAPPGADAPA